MAKQDDSLKRTSAAAKAAASEIEELNLQIKELSERLDKSPMEFDVSNIKEARKAVKELRNEFENSAISVKDITQGISSMAAEIAATGTGLKKARASFNSLESLAQKLQQHTEGTSKLSETEVQSLVEKIKLEKTNLETAKSYLESEQSKKTLNEAGAAALEEINSSLAKQNKEGENAINWYSELVKSAEARLEYEKDLTKSIDKNLLGVKATSKVLENIPGLGGLASAFSKAAEAGKEAAIEAGNADVASKASRNSLIASGKAAIFSNGAALAGLGTIFRTILSFAFEVDSQIVELGKSLGVSREEAEKFRDGIAEIGANLDMSDENLMLTTKNLLEARSQLADQSGLQKGFAEAELISQVRMTKNVGLQAESMAKLTDRARLQGKTTEDILDSTIAATSQLMLQTGIIIDNREVMEEVAQIDGQLAANYKNNPALIAKAVVETRKLGMNLQQARDASKGLLNFEESIGAELEAELLTGKSINLENARALALQGKTAEAAQELAKNFGSIEEFQNMNVLAQESLAQAVGMSADELSNVLVQEQNIANLSEGVKKDLEDRVRLLKDQGKVEEANALMSQTATEEQAKAALMTLNAQDKMAAVMEKITNFAGTLVDNMGLLIGILTGVAALMAAVAVSSIIASGGAALIGAGVAAAAVGIGGLALTAGLPGDSEPESMNDGMIDSDGGLIVKGEKGMFQLNKDDKIIAGTDLDKPSSSSSNNSSNNQSAFNTKLDKLIAAIEKGGNVYLNGNKVGEAMVIGSHKS